MTNDPILGVVRETFGRVVYTHKTHEKDREFATRRATRLKRTNVVLIALTSGGLVATAIVGETGYLWISAILATLSLGFSVFELNTDPSEEAARHRAAAKSLLVIRERFTHLIADICTGLPTDEARARRDSIQADLDEIYHQAPDTSRRAYKAASQALKVNEEMTFTDEELDRFLPAQLRMRAQRY
ncbi:SLATT domain-containing protein [Rhodococcus sp. NPDC003318]|uniref:SLATT domain-containing protein n=1 Tax=Rhodococcus sp. NPDC003318 TaxID=3364503 RepID=UPI0036BD7285